MNKNIIQPGAIAAGEREFPGSPGALSLVYDPRVRNFPPSLTPLMPTHTLQPRRRPCTSFPVAPARAGRQTVSLLQPHAQLTTLLSIQLPSLLPHEKVGFVNTASLPSMVSKNYTTTQAGCFQNQNEKYVCIERTQTKGVNLNNA